MVVLGSFSVHSPDAQKPPVEAGGLADSNHNLDMNEADCSLPESTPPVKKLGKAENPVVS